MQSKLHTYHDLLHQSTPCSTPNTPENLFLLALRALIDFASRQNRPLDLDGPWRLNNRDAHSLTKSYDITPPGGWQGFVGLLAGTPWASLTPKGFCFHISADDTHDLDDAHIQKTLLEAFTLKLVPPTSAAGLFLHMGIHPSWGLRLANATHNLDHDQSSSLASCNLDGDTLQAIGHGVFTTISILLEILSTLETNHKYPLTIFAKLVDMACSHGRTHIAQHTGHVHLPHTPIFYDDFLHTKTTDFSQRALDFTMLDIVDALLTPAGIVKRHDDYTFTLCSDPSFLLTTQIQCFQSIQHNGFLIQMLEYDQPNALVA